MNNMYLFDKKTLAFYPLCAKEAYKEASLWPDEINCVEIDEQVFIKFSGGAPKGKQRGADENGMPCWVDLPPLTEKEKKAMAESKKNAYMRISTERIAPLQDAVELEIATPEEEKLLKAWKKYRVLLNRLDTSQPDINWPEKPE